MSLKTWPKQQNGKPVRARQCERLGWKEKVIKRFRQGEILREREGGGSCCSCHHFCPSLSHQGLVVVHLTSTRAPCGTKQLLGSLPFGPWEPLKDLKGCLLPPSFSPSPSFSLFRLLFVDFQRTKWHGKFQSGASELICISFIISMNYTGFCICICMRYSVWLSKRILACHLTLVSKLTIYFVTCSSVHTDWLW